jgi:hypothetical protein
MSHISDDDLELYVMNQLPPASLPTLEEHLLFCHDCQDRVEEVENWISHLRVALRQTTELLATHILPDGPVRLSVHPLESGGWAPRILGPSLDCGSILQDAAVDYCRRSFTEMFAEHVCCEGCHDITRSGTRTRI